MRYGSTARIAMATCATLRPEERDDMPLRQAFLARGCDLAEPCWHDPTVDWSSFDVTLIRTTWDYVDRIEEYLAWIDHVDAVGTLLNPRPVVRWNIDKRYLRALAARGVPTIPTLWFEAPEQFDALRCADWLRDLDRAAAHRLFVKPAIGATASGTLRTSADDDGLAKIADHANDLLATAPAVLVQPYLPTVESLGERSAIVIDGRLTHAVTKRPRPGDYRVQDDWGGSDTPHELNDAEIALVAATIAATESIFDDMAAKLPMTYGQMAYAPMTYARIDWLVDETGAPRLVELELIEPSLFLRHAAHAADALADAVLRRIRTDLPDVVKAGPP